MPAKKDANYERSKEKPPMVAAFLTAALVALTSEAQPGARAPVDGAWGRGVGGREAARRSPPPRSVLTGM